MGQCQLNSVYTVGKFKYYSLRRIGSTNAPRYYPRGVGSSTWRHYALSHPPLVKRSPRRRPHHRGDANRRQNGANRRLYKIDTQPEFTRSFAFAETQLLQPLSQIHCLLFVTCI
jgi:hypothetical protein